MTRRTNWFLLLCILSVVMTVLYGFYGVWRTRSSAAKAGPGQSREAWTRNPAPSSVGVLPGADQPSITKSAAKANSIAKKDLSARSTHTPAKPKPAGRLYFLTNTPGDSNHKLVVAPLDALDQVNDSLRFSCERVSFAGGKGLCLAWDGSVNLGSARNPFAMLAKFTGYSAVIFDQQFHAGTTIKLQGLPNRVRISPSGRRAGITVFLFGESYASLRFSTRTTIVDLSTGEVLADLERFSVTREGTKFESPDFNFWGVTFTHDDNRFYATLWSKGKAYLVECDLAKRTANVIYDGVECPSISPDNQRIAFKKRLSAVGVVTTWRISLLDLKTLTETPLAETRNVDDQVEWLDDDDILYALPQSHQPDASTDIFVLPASAEGSPLLFLKNAFSPAVVRGGID